MALGRTNDEIAGELYISISTVKAHLASLMRKLGVRNRVELAMWAYEARPSQYRVGGAATRDASLRRSSGDPPA